MKSIGMLLICSALAGSAGAQSIIKKKSGKKVPTKQSKLHGKNQNTILNKYILKNVFFGGKRMGRGKGGDIIAELERGFLDKHKEEKKEQWVDNKRKFLSGEITPGLEFVWDWDKGNGIGSASNQSCSEVCPESLEALAISSDKFLRKQEHFLSFRNREEDMMDSYKRLYGYCWGHSSFSSSLKMFSFFDPANKSGLNVPDESDKRAWKRYYTKIIKNIFNNKAEVIPYFSSINEMASDRRLKNTFKDYVAKRWGRLAVRNANFKALDEMYKSAPSYKEHVETYETLKRKVSTLQSPRINFHRYGVKAYSHVVTVIGVEQFKDGRFKIFVEDPNVFPKNSPAEQKYIEIKPTSLRGSGGAKIYATYNFYDTEEKRSEKGQSRLSRSSSKMHIGKIKILDESDSFHEHAAVRLNQFCVKQSGCQK